VDNPVPRLSVCHRNRMSDDGPTDSDALPIMMLNPYVRVLWRSNDTVQLELGRRRVVLQGVNTPALTSLLGTRSRSSPPQRQNIASRRENVPPSPGPLPSGLQTVAKQLRLAGFMVDAQLPTAVTPSWHAAELAAVTATEGDRGPATLSRRASSLVRIDGTSRLAVTIATTLCVAGIGHVYVNGSGQARLSHCGPGALSLADEGERFNLAVARRLSEHAPAVNIASPPPGVHPDLVILADEAAPDPDELAQLQRQEQPHLFASSTIDCGVVGPTVLPGRSSCHRCADLHRVERDEAWQVLAAQLAVTPARSAGAPVALSTIVAGLAAAQALALIDGSEVTTLNGGLEIHPPDYRVRRRTWQPHRDCGCLR